MAFRLAMSDLGVKDDMVIEADDKNQLKQNIKQYFESRNADKWNAMSDAQKDTLRAKIRESVSRL